MDATNLRWSKVRGETYLALAPFEFVSRWIIYLYQRYALSKIVVATTGLVALWVSLLELTDRSQDRKVQLLMYFNETKSASGSTFVVNFFERLRADGVPFEEIPSSGANLDGLVLDDKHISKGNFSSSQIMNSSFQRATMVDVEFSESFLNVAKFQNASLQSTSFHNSKLAGADFSGAVMQDADFGGAFLFGTNFTGASLKEGLFSLVSGGTPIFIDADLQEASFFRAEISEADFTRANLAGAEFGGAKLGKAVFTGADLAGAKFIFRGSGAPEIADVSPELLEDACVSGEQPTLPPTREFAAIVLPACQ